MDNILVEKVDNTPETDGELLENANLEKNEAITQSNKNIKNFDDSKNITKEIEYITTNNKGEIFKILAKYGNTNREDKNILNLEVVEGTITSKKKSQIYISSDYANYNYTNQNSKFYSNVEIKYDDKIINCDNFDLIIEDNIAVAYDNVIVKDNKSIMRAETITLDLITKDIEINSKEKVKIIKN